MYYCFFRDTNNNEDEDGDKRKNINDMRGIMGSITDERQEIPEILLISSNENNGRGSKPLNIELVKFLVNYNFIKLLNSTDYPAV